MILIFPFEADGGGPPPPPTDDELKITPNFNFQQLIKLIFRRRG